MNLTMIPSRYVLAMLALGASAGLATTASAQQQGTWDGAYGGIALGYGDFDTDGSTVGDADGAIGGFFLGYNRDYGDWVAGAELSYDFVDGDFKGSGGQIEEIARLKIRAGRDFGQSLVYVVGGPAWAEASLAGGGSNDETGWFAGVGVDHKLTERWVLGGEVLYNQFDDLAGRNNDVDGVTMMLRASLRF
ncbi:outer membrane immunogenic protein [Rhodobacteraceae bacterium MBR-64]